MNDPDETLSAIDAALDGWTTSDRTVSLEAMRWAPEPPDHARDARVSAAPAGTSPNRSGEWTEIGRATATSRPPAGDACDDERVPTPPTRREVSMTLTPEQIETLGRFAEHIRWQRDAIRAVILRTAKSLMTVVARTHAATAPALYGDEYRRHRRTCRACNPAGNPKPLKVNGPDYTRRRRRRRRRGR